MATRTTVVVKTTTTTWRFSDDELVELLRQSLTIPENAQVDVEFEIRQNSLMGATVRIKETEHG